MWLCVEQVTLGAGMFWTCGDDAGMFWTCGNDAGMFWICGNDAGMFWTCGDGAGMFWTCGDGAGMFWTCGNGTGMFWTCGNDAGMFWTCGNGTGMFWTCAGDLNIDVQRVLVFFIVVCFSCSKKVTWTLYCHTSKKGKPYNENKTFYYNRIQSSAIGKAYKSVLVITKI